VASPLTRNETKALIEDLRELLERLRQGEFDASGGMLLRIEGAVNALQIVLGEADRSDFV
jgi:hypothetical protein